MVETAYKLDVDPIQAAARTNTCTERNFWKFSGTKIREILANCQNTRTEFRSGAAYIIFLLILFFAALLSETATAYIITRPTDRHTYTTHTYTYVRKHDWSSSIHTDPHPSWAPSSSSSLWYMQWIKFSWICASVASFPLWVRLRFTKIYFYSLPWSLILCEVNT